MRTILAIPVALALLAGCSGRQLRPGPRHAGLRAAIYEHTPIDDHPNKNKFRERPPTRSRQPW